MVEDDDDDVDDAGGRLRARRAFVQRWACERERTSGCVRIDLNASARSVAPAAWCVDLYCSAQKHATREWWR